MLITVHTDKHIQGREDVAQTIQSMVEAAVGDFSQWLTRIEVHLSDENGDKSGDNDKRCLIDAHPKRSEHIATRHDAPTVREAIDGATDKLVKVLQKMNDKRIERHHGRET